MTVIAWDGKTLAADKLSTDGTVRRTSTKVVRAANGALMAACGDASRCREMHAWYERGASPDDFPPAQRIADTAAWLFVVEPGPVLKYFQATPYPLVIEDKQFTMGSGRDYAAAAMHLGLCAYEACAVAIALCPECGNGIDALELEPTAPARRPLLMMNFEACVVRVIATGELLTGVLRLRPPLRPAVDITRTGEIVDLDNPAYEVWKS